MNTETSAATSDDVAHTDVATSGAGKKKKKNQSLTSDVGAFLRSHPTKEEDVNDVEKVASRPDEAARAVVNAHYMPARGVRWDVVQKYWESLSWKWKLIVLARLDGGRIIVDGSMIEGGEDE